MGDEVCLECKKKLEGKQTKFCSIECKTSWYSKDRSYKLHDEYDPMLALWTKIILPDNLANQLKDNLKKFSDLGHLIMDNSQIRHIMQIRISVTTSSL